MNGSAPPPLPASSRPRPKRSWVKILLLVLGIPLGLIVLLVSCGLLWDLTARDVEVEERDRLAVLTAETMKPWMSASFDATAGTETISKRKYIDGSYEVEYEFDYETEDERLYLHCMLSVEKTASDARSVYTISAAGEDIGFAFTDVHLETRDDLFRWGTKSRCSLLVTDAGKPGGNHFVCMTGTKILDVTIAGVYFDEGEALGQLLRPVLTRVDAYEP